MVAEHVCTVCELERGKLLDVRDGLCDWCRRPYAEGLAAGRAEALNAMREQTENMTRWNEKVSARQAVDEAERALAEVKA